MRRTLSISFLAAAILLVLPSTASAKGGFEPRDRSLAWGETVAATDRFSIPRPARWRPHSGTLADRPFYAYLVPPGSFLERGSPIPPRAVLLGEIELEPVDPAFDCCWFARIVFTVPRVPPGDYFIDVCNRPCTIDGIGDLSGGGVWIGRTELEARLLSRAALAKAKLHGLRRQLHILAGTRERLSEAQMEAAQLRRDLADVRSALAEARSAPEASPSSPPWLALSLAAVFGVGLGSVGATLFARRNRGSRAAAQPETRMTPTDMADSGGAAKTHEVAKT